MLFSLWLLKADASAGNPVNVLWERMFLKGTAKVAGHHVHLTSFLAWCECRKTQFN